MNRLMVDIETLGTSKRAAILSAAFVVFNLDGIIDRLEFFYNPERQKGRVIEFATVAWWMDQSAEARAAAFKPPFQSSPIPSLEEVKRKWIEHDIKEVWARGATFDIVLLEDWLYGWPWHFRQVMCMRSLLMLYPSIPLVSPTLKHSALADAEAQAEWTRQVLRIHGVKE